MAEIFTIGHSNHSMETFLQILRNHAIQVVVDVRSTPYSRYVPQYNKQNLEPVLKEQKFIYLYLGDSIGGKPDTPSLCDSAGKVDYEKIADTEKFQQGINRLLQGLRDGWRITLLCAEENPEKCHRQWLIARELELKHDVRVTHIRADGDRIPAGELLAGKPVQQKLF